MDLALLNKLDELVSRRDASRSGMIRAAVEAYLKEAMRDELERAEIEAYRKLPPRKGEFPPSDRSRWKLGDRW